MSSLHPLLRLGAFVAGCWAAALIPAAEPAATAAPEMHGVVQGLFDDQTGDRLGRLRIERVFVENRQHGFLRVAWRPRVIMEGVTLEFGAGAAWPSSGTQLLAALRKLGLQDDGELRRLRLVLGTPADGGITAETARLRPDGALELTRVSATATGALPTSTSSGETLCFWLTGPQAGRLTPLPPATPISRPVPSPVVRDRIPLEK